MEINIKKEVYGTMDENILKLTEALQGQGFGVLTRINFHEKIKEKTGKEISPVIILGVCIPQLAYDAYLINSDASSLLPCNAVIRQVSSGVFSIELTKPSSLLNILGDEKILKIGEDADRRLQKVLDHLDGPEQNLFSSEYKESYLGPQ